MLGLKKLYRDELLQFALLLSLLRVNPDYYFESDLYSNITDLDFENGTSWRSYGPSFRTHHIHPKSIDSVLANYRQDLFADINSLGRYSTVSNYQQNRDITAYLFSVDRSTVPFETFEPFEDNTSRRLEEVIPQQQRIESGSSSVASDSTQEQTETGDFDLGLTQEDMDLIEVLWKQDVDLGFSLQQESSASPEKPQEAADNALGSAKYLKEDPGDHDDDYEKLKTLKAINQESSIKVEENVTDWNSLNYTIDTETGEYVIKTELERPLSAANCDDEDPSCVLPLEDLSLPIPEFLLEEAFQFVGLDDDIPEEGIDAKAIGSVTLDPCSLSDIPLPAASALSNPVESTCLAPVPDASPAGPVGTQTDTAAVVDDSSSEDSAVNLIKDLEADEDLSILADMIQTPQFHHSHHRAFQSRMPFVRTVSMEQRWQDLASLLSLQNPGDASAMPHPFSHHHPLHNYSHPAHSHSMGYGPDARGVLIHNATLNPPMGDLNASVPYNNLGGTNLGNAVATSMNLTNSSEPMGEPNSAPHYKLEPAHDMMSYYQNGTSEMNQNDGFLSSILNDEDLQLMDMAMNEGMYTMRMLDSNNALNNLSMNGTGSAPMSRIDVERMDTSSDSAVSSMGSERVPSLSDGEWCDGGSDSGHNTADHYGVDYHTNKYRPFDYSYSGRPHNSTLGGSTDPVRMPPVAQKKHQMFGKRYFQEQSANLQPSLTPVKYEYRDPGTSYSTPTQVEGAVGPKPPEIKYSSSLEFGRHSHHPQMGRSPIQHIQHNHTYHLPAENTGAMQRPVSRDKLKSRKSEEEHLTRDEKRARSLSVPISVDDIINLPMDEFNEKLSKYDLSETQLSLIRDIRRRGKNKVAAQNCRKRKLDQIISLADEVNNIRDRKLQLLNERDFVMQESKRIKDKYQQLYRHVFQNLRDPDGNPYSPYQYSLQTSADGSILIVPRSNSSLPNTDLKDPHSSQKE